MTPRTDACIAQYRSGSLDFCWTLTEMARNLEVELAEADAAAKRWYEAASPCGTPTALQETLTQRRLYEKALKMIADFTGTIGDHPMGSVEKLSWAQEFAREALQGIDPSIGVGRN